MATELRDLMGELEVSLVESVACLEHARADGLYVAVLDLEQRVAALHDALVSVADNIADRGRTHG